MNPPPFASILASLVALSACASSSSEDPIDASSTTDGAGNTDAADPEPGTDAGGNAAMCPAGQFATGIAAHGTMTCATVDAATATAVRARCSIYAGTRDSCNGCTDPPAKWSRTGPLGCTVGAGGGNACVSTLLDDAVTPVSLAALDFDGDVNGDDKFYATMHCIAVPRDPRPAPCQPDWAISFKSGDSWMCTPVSEAAVAYVGGQCSVYTGWRDSCDGCTTAPAKWGRASDASCANGTGADNTCTATTLGGEAVNLFGLSYDGDVDGNDKLYFGLSCAAPAAGETVTMEACPAGQFVVATHADGSFSCADPAVTFSEYVRDECTMFFGWRDSCDACTQPPAKWGAFSTGSCANGTGADNTCADTALGDVTLPLFGLSTDGNVNGDDTLYVGFRCNP